MKRLAAILLLCVLLFNWFGYRILSDYYVQQADLALEQQLDENEYDESRLIEIKVPLKMPYQSTFRKFERYDGEIEVNGIHYKYVKRAIYNDSLILMCLPNDGKMKLNSVRNDFFKLVNDIQNTSQGKKSDQGNQSTVKSPFSEYYAASNIWLVPKLTAFFSQHFIYSSSACAAGFKVSPDQPPEA